MQWMTRCLGVSALLVGMVSWAWAGVWPRVEEAVTAWDGPLVAVLTTREGDPVEAPWDLELIELLTRHGFEVRTAPTEEGRVEGLVLEVRTVDDDVAVVVRRASDRTIIGFERHGAAVAVPLPAPVPVKTMPTSGGVWTLDGHPVQVGILEVDPGKGGVEIALLGGARLDVVRLDAKGPRVLDSWVPPVRPARGLRLDVADLDGDGVLDLATTWAEDVESIYEGVQSTIHGWVLGGTPFAPMGGDRGGYLRVVDGRVWTQRRETFRPFAEAPAPVPSFSKKGETAKPWFESRNLYEVTPWEERWVGWTREGRLSVMAAGGGATGGAVSSMDFGPWNGPAVSVRLVEPEFRSGFEKEDRVNDRQVVLSRRVAVGADGAVYLIRRGRREGGLLVGRSAGADAVVRGTLRGNEIVTELPFGEEETFILDFGLLPEGAGVVLLLNEKADGSGQAHVAVRGSR